MKLKSTEKVETNRYELEIEIDADTFRNSVQTAYKKNVNKMNIPGFRKGRASRAMVEKMYGSDVFYEDAMNILYPDALDDAIVESGLDVIEDKIDFDLVSIGNDGVVFKVKLTVKPEVTLGEYKGISVTKPVICVSDDQISEELKKMQEKTTRLVSINDRTAELGDVTIIDFDGYLDGVQFDGGKAEGFSLKLGSGQFIPGFEDQIVGHNIEDEFEVNVSFPDEYGVEELSGKPVVFKVKLHEIKINELPILDDNFAKDVSEFDTLDELKQDISNKILEEITHKSEDALETSLIEKILENFQAEIPEALILNRINDNLKDFEYRLKSQGINIQDYIKYTGSNEEDFKANFRENAERQVKVRLALEKIGELEGLTPTTEDIDAEYEKFIKAYSVEIEKIKAAIPEKEVINDLIVKKAIDFVKENAVITEINTSDDIEVESVKPKTVKKTVSKKVEEEIV